MNAREREGWPDVAKGICIVLVVLWHVVTKHQVDIAGAGAVTDAWAMLNAQLLPLRMPLFFLVSGLFAGRAVKSLSGVSWRRRAIRLAAAYVVWVLIQSFALSLTPDFDTARATNVGELLAQLTFSPTNLWYLLALALYLAIARSARRVPTAILLPLAFTMSAVAASGVLPDLGNLWQIFQNLFFFLAGLRLRPAIERFAVSVGAMRAFVLGSAYVVCAAVVGILGMRQWPGVWTVLSVVAVSFGVAGCALIDRRAQRLARPLRWIGRRTLPIYVIHMIPLALLDGFLRSAGMRTAAPMEALEPVVLSAVVIAICLGLHVLLVRCGLGALFDPFLVVDAMLRRRSERPRRPR